MAAGGRAAPGDDLWTAAPRRPTLVVAVTRPREELDRRIAERVRRELDEGLVAELEAALDTPGVSREALQVIGAREVAAIRAGELDAVRAARAPGGPHAAARAQAAHLAAQGCPASSPLDLGDAPAEDALPALLALWRGAEEGPVTSGG